MSGLVRNPAVNADQNIVTAVDRRWDFGISPDAEDVSRSSLMAQWPQSSLRGTDGAQIAVQALRAGAPGAYLMATMPWRSGARWPYVLAGIAKDSAGAALGGAMVRAFLTATDVEQAETISAADGAYSVGVPSNAAHYVVSYKAGSPDVAGVSLNTLIPV